jgi:hypothetical protein
MTPPRLQPLLGTVVGSAGRHDARVFDIPNLSNPACVASGVMPDTWHHSGHSEAAKADTRAAIAICNTCPDIEPCLAYALAHRIDDGVFGGLSATQRRELRERGSAA